MGNNNCCSRCCCPKIKKPEDGKEIAVQFNNDSNNSNPYIINTQPTQATTIEPKEVYLNTISDYVATLDYDAEKHDEISLKKNDPIEFIKTENEDYCIVQNMRTGQTGFVPKSCVAFRDSLEAQDWYFPNTTRREAERLLEYLDNEQGVFLVRESEQDKGNYALSILFIDDKNERKTRHYKIRKSPRNTYYIGAKKPFGSIQDLISHYRQFGGLCCDLVRPYPKETKFNGIRDVWEEPSENIEKQENIGSGNFGEVFKGMWRKKHVVAIKTVKLDNIVGKIDDDPRYIEFKKELEIMKKLRHEKIVKLWCVCTKSQPILLVTEYMKNGSLLNYLREGKGKLIGLKEIIDMAAQIASGMSYLESSNCIHRDLAARNILVGEMNIVKIADFGLAKLVGNEKENEKSDQNDKFPVKWSPPEVFSVDPITGKRPYSTKSDVWSFGILLYEVITKGGSPYPGMNNMQVTYEVKENKYRMPKPDRCPDEFYDIILKCWKEDPQSRPTFETLFNIFDDYYVQTEGAGYIP